ncbi:cupin domain-containing protein [candidate division KSB1 bacterium]|nr:cupin domain-containing protein [candidate division KSB1 bacterium]
MIFLNGDMTAQQVNPLVKRKILAYSGALMMQKVFFKKGGIGEPHCHEDHEQIGYIVSGKFLVRVGEKMDVLGPGDSFYAGKGVIHGVEALEDAVIIDVFTPIRKDLVLK